MSTLLRFLHYPSSPRLLQGASTRFCKEGTFVSRPRLEVGLTATGHWGVSSEASSTLMYPEGRVTQGGAR
jgi:hypothetical protein